MSDNTRPLLSVIIPIYNVEDYLEECLRSVADQHVQDIEVVMVDDGSKDSSPEIAAKWADSDSRFRLVRQDNHGLGHARNTGLAHADGSYLAFLDSDDAVPADGYQRMIESLERTGSDFAVGNVMRFNSSSTWQSGQYEDLFSDGERTAHLRDEHRLLRDTLAHNKVWRTDFWRRHGFEFPVGVYYEDIPVTLPAHMVAERVDLVDVTAVNWRLRESGDSITQRKAESPSHFTDRFDAVMSNLRFFAEHDAEAVAIAYRQTVLERDFLYAVNTFDQVDAEYQEILRSRITQFLSEAGPAALEGLASGIRIRYELLRAGDLEPLALLLRLERAKRLGDQPAVVEGGRAYLDLGQGADFDRFNVDAAALDITDQIDLGTGLSEIRREGDEVAIDGWAYVRRLSGVDHTGSEIELWAEIDDTRVDATLHRRDEPQAVARADSQADGIAATGFTARFAIADLADGYRRQRRWRIMVSASVAGVKVVRPLRTADLGGTRRVLMEPLADDWWLRFSWVNDELLARLKREPAVLASAVQTRRGLDLALRIAKGFTGSLELRADGDLVHRVPVKGSARDGKTVKTTVRLADLDRLGTADAERNRTWRPVVVDGSNGKSHDLNVADGHTFRRRRGLTRELFVRRTKSGVARFFEGAVRPAFAEASWSDGGRLRLRIDDPNAAPGAVLVLRLDRTEDAVRIPLSADRGGYTAEFDPDPGERIGGTGRLRRGWWRMRVERPDGTAQPIAVKDDPRNPLPLTVRHGGRDITLATKGMQETVLIVDWDIAADEVGKTNQWLLQQRYYQESKGELRDAVVYEVFRGQTFSDSPREIFEELRARGADLEHYVVSDDQQVAVPEGAVAVAKFSREYYRVMAQSRYVVASTHLPEWFEKAPGQTVVQTWHGTPLKRIGLDIDDVQFASPFYRDKLRREAAMWDYMISASDYTTPIMRSAFGFTGELLETGLPRNDKFYGGQAERLYAEVRERLGLPADRKLLLYGPTWRDTAFGSRGRYALDLRCDLEALDYALGEDWTVLFRKHANVANGLSAEQREFAIDVSDYPDVQDLLCAADVLVTDYSSLMFDFANTGRPMLFFTYDLENYRDQLRGFYFDFEAESPGPLLKNNDDLLKAMFEIDAVKAEYADRYRSFRDKFCTWDDGRAATRVADAVFGPRPADQ